MTLAQAKSRHDDLAGQLRHHDFLYYGEGKPVLTDFDYDKLYTELEELEQKFPSLVTVNSPTQRVGGEPSTAFQRIEHLVPMLSLEKIRASDRPTSAEQPDVEKRKREQDECTLKELEGFDDTIRKELRKQNVKAESIDYVLEPKVDGVSISVHYRNGKLVMGATRGDGRSGDDITTNIRTIRSLPLELKIKNPPALLEVRGEAFISILDFEKMNDRLRDSGEEPFPNARNATAGTLKQLDPKLVASRPIRIVFYAIGACEGVRFETHADTLEYLNQCGLPTQQYWWLCHGIKDVVKRYNSDVVCDYHESKDLRTKVPYEVDGIVLKVNSSSYWRLIPDKARSPGYAIVHKPVPWITPAETVLNSITVQVGRTGVLTPVAELEPVFVQGSTIARATLHNEDEIKRKDIRLGDTVIIRKAGMVIPEVVEVVKSKRSPLSEPFDMLRQIKNRCPVCEGSIAKEEISGSGTAARWRCQNVALCPAQLYRRIEYFAQRRALDIESLGGIVAEKLVERGLVREPMDLFDLSIEQLAKLNLGTNDQPRTFGIKNATKVVETLGRAKTMPLNRWLYALAISDVGEITANDLARVHDSFGDLAKSKIVEGIAHMGDLYEEFAKKNPGSDENKDKPQEEKERLKRERDSLKIQVIEVGSNLEKIGGAKSSVKWEALKQKGSKAIPDYLPIVGYEAARSVLKFFSSATGEKVLKRMEELGIQPVSPTKTATHLKRNLLSGKTFVITGTLASMSRDQASDQIRDRGGSVTSSVSKNTDFVVVGADAGSKFAKAQELGVPILNEKEFCQLLESSSSSKGDQLT
jgi:DNA ligase (NAD+)